MMVWIGGTHLKIVFLSGLWNYVIVNLLKPAKKNVAKRTEDCFYCNGDTGPAFGCRVPELGRVTRVTLSPFPGFEHHGDLGVEHLSLGGTGISQSMAIWKMMFSPRFWGYWQKIFVPGGIPRNIWPWIPHQLWPIGLWLERSSLASGLEVFVKTPFLVPRLWFQDKNSVPMIKPLFIVQ